MNINSALVKQLRTGKFCSQEQMAKSSGLNLRTVQRFENEASAALQSTKALSAIVDIAVKKLEYAETIMMQRYEYKTPGIEWKQGFLSGLKSAALPGLQGILIREEEEGWRLVQIFLPISYCRPKPWKSGSHS